MLQPTAVVTGSVQLQVTPAEAITAATAAIGVSNAGEPIGMQEQQQYHDTAAVAGTGAEYDIHNVTHI